MILKKKSFKFHPHTYICTRYYAFESSRVRGVIGCKINDTMNNAIFLFFLFFFLFISRHIYSSVLRNLSKSFDPVRDKLTEN